MNSAVKSIFWLSTLFAFAYSARTQIVNGGFEASSSNTTTPPGWLNIGHDDGVIEYTQFPTQPIYEGNNFYDLGGFGAPEGPLGDGLAGMPDRSLSEIISRHFNN